MANYVNVEVCCPSCGKFLFQEHQNAEGTHGVNGSRRCPNCKKMIGYRISGGHANTWIED